MTRSRALLFIGIAAAAALWLTNTSRFADTSDHETRLIAHRGVHQTYIGTSRDAQTCRAAEIGPPTHAFIENTLPSMQAAFAAGADVVELDVHLTQDNQFAVFHDWTLECQTNGTGITHKQTLAALQALDLGYGFTADGGATFPFRGLGITMPSLDAVLESDLTGQILVNFKSNRAREGRTLAERHARDPMIFGVYGGGPPTDAAKSGWPRLQGFHRADLKACAWRYALIGWSGYVPEACRTGLLGVPMNFGPWLWGWPHKFTDRMAQAGTDVILWGPYDGSGFSSGIDDESTLRRVPRDFDGYVWTNRIEVIGPLVKY